MQSDNSGHDIIHGGSDDDISLKIMRAGMGVSAPLPATKQSAKKYTGPRTDPHGCPPHGAPFPTLSSSSLPCPGYILELDLKVCGVQDFIRPLDAHRNPQPLEDELGGPAERADGEEDNGASARNDGLSVTCAHAVVGKLD